MDLILGQREVLTQVSASWAPFGLSVEDRRRHVYVIGKTGSGKSTLLRNMMAQDIEAGRGLMLLDPHGDLAEELLDFVPPRRAADVIYLAPADLSHPVGFNLLDRVPPDDRPLVAANVVSTFKHIWGESWGPRLEYVLYNAVAALLDFPASRGGVSLLAVPRLFTDPAYRARIIREVRDARVRSFWEQEFAGYSGSFATEVASPIQNKIGALLAAPAVRNVVGQATSTLHMAEAMNDRKVIIANVSKGLLGEAACNLIGSLLVTATQLAALRRASIPEEERVDFAAYLDEFQNFTTDSFASILAESRKYRLSLTIGHQYLEQVRPPVRAAIFGNVGTLVSFTVGHDDAEELAGEFDPYGAETLTALSRGEVCVRTVRGGAACQPFMGQTNPKLGLRYGGSELVKKQSQRRYGHGRVDVEQKIERWGRPVT